MESNRQINKQTIKLFTLNTSVKSQIGLSVKDVSNATGISKQR